MTAYGGIRSAHDGSMTRAADAAGRHPPGHSIDDRPTESRGATVVLTECAALVGIISAHKRRMEMRGERAARLTAPMIAALGVRFFFNKFCTALRFFGATHRSKPPLVCASVSTVCCAGVASFQLTISRAVSRFA